MRVTYSRRALRQLEDIHAYIAERNPQAASRVIARIQELCQKLGDYPGLGTKTDDADVWMLPVVRYPYNILALQGIVWVIRMRL